VTRITTFPSYDGIYLKLDQTTPQTIINDAPIFDVGLVTNDTIFNGGNLYMSTAGSEFQIINDGTDAIKIMSDGSNYSKLSIGLNSGLGYTFIQSVKDGTGTLLPISFWVGSGVGAIRAWDITILGHLYAGSDGSRTGNILTAGTIGAGVSTFAGNNGNTTFTLLNLNNNFTPLTGQTGETSDLVFNLTQSINSVVSLHEAAKISAYKVSDWFHATTEADTDSGLKFWTTNSGTPTLQLTIDETGYATFVGTVSAEQLTSTHDARVGHQIEIWPDALGVADDGSLIIFAEGSLNNLSLTSNDAGTSDIYSVEQLYFRCADNDFTFMHNLYTGAFLRVSVASTYSQIQEKNGIVDFTNVLGVEPWFRVNVSGVDPVLTSTSGTISFDNENLTTTGTVNNGTLYSDTTDQSLRVGFQAGLNVVAGAIQGMYLGYQAGLGSATLSTSAADYNIAIGYRSLYSNQSGSYDIAIGAQSLQANTTGPRNIAIGHRALYVNTTGTDNIAIGYRTLYANLTGGYNFAIGTQALYDHTAGNYNTAMGLNSLSANLTGANNLAIGYYSGANNNGSSNVFIGYYGGAYETGSSTFYIDAINRTDSAGDRGGALLYGIFNATIASQALNINAGNVYIADVGTVGAEKLTNGTFTGGSTSWTLGAVWFYGYTFTVSGVTTAPTAGATYTNNGITYTVKYATITDGAGLVYTTGAGDPTASGTLVKTGGTGDDNIAFSTFATNEVFKGANGTSTLSQTSAAMVTPLIIGELYYLSYEISNWTVGTVTPSCGGVTLPASASLNGTNGGVFVPTSTANLVFTPTSTSRFTIDSISLKKVTGGNLNLGGSIDLMGSVKFGTATEYINSANADYLDLHSTKDTRITCGANYTLLLSPVVWNDINMSMVTAKVPAANFPTWTAFTTNLNSYTFAVNDYVDMSTAEILHDYKEGTDIALHIHIVTNGLEVGATKAQYTIYYSWGDMNEAMSAEETLTAELTIPGGTADKTHLFLDMGDITGTSYKIGSLLKMRVKRIAKSAGGADPAANPFVEQVGIHYQIERLGSRQELVA
jgi:hypothetical protein